MIFTYGYTKYCCVNNCGSIATNWRGWLRKSRDGINAGFCDKHKPDPKEPDLKGIYNKGLGEIQHKPKNVHEHYGLNKNLIEQ